MECTEVIHGVYEMMDWMYLQWITGEKVAQKEAGSNEAKMFLWKKMNGWFWEELSA